MLPPLPEIRLPVSLESPATIASTSPVRVLLFDHTAVLGGGEIALADMVQRFDRTRVDPVVLLGSHGLLESLLEGRVPVHVLPIEGSVVHARKEALGIASLLNPAPFVAALGYIRNLMRFLDEHRIEIIHTNSLKASVLGGIAGRLARRKVIWHVRDRIAADYLPSKVVLLMRQLAKIIPNFIIGNSLATLKTLDLSHTPSIAIPSGVDLAKFFSQSERSEPDQLLPADSPRVIGLVGRICPWKGQHIFIEAAALIHAQWPDARFQIIGAALFGEVEYERELHQQVERAGLSGVLDFLGFQNDIAPLIRSLDILVHASVVGEPFGQVIVQGMASAKPVVATDGGGVPETVVDGVTGLLVPMADAAAMARAVSALLADPAAARQMGLRGRERVLAHFTIEQSTRRVTEVYERVAGR